MQDARSCHRPSLHLRIGSSFSSTESSHDPPALGLVGEPKSTSTTKNRLGWITSVGSLGWCRGCVEIYVLSFKQDGFPLATAATQCNSCSTTTASAKFFRGSQRQSRTGCANRVTQRTST